MTDKPEIPAIDAVDDIIPVHKEKEIIEQDISTNQQELISVVNYVGNDLKGEILVYKNLSSNDKSLREQAFYGTNVIAVAISNKDLKPFEITKIYRVVKNG